MKLMFDCLLPFWNFEFKKKKKKKKKKKLGLAVLFDVSDLFYFIYLLLNDIYFIYFSFVYFDKTDKISSRNCLTCLF